MDKTGRRNFQDWILVKEKIHFFGKDPSIKEGEVWWASVGENVGTEICGKGKEYMRPVIVLRKLTRNSFLAVPLTSKSHKGSWYACFELNNKKQTAVVAQVEYMSSLRLRRKIGQLSKKDYCAVLSTLKDLL